MLTDLSMFDKGSLFPPFPERERLNKYRDAKYLYDGKHSRVFTRWTHVAGTDGLSVVVNWHRRLSLLWADMLFGQEPEFTADNQEYLNEVVMQNDLIERLYETAIDASRFGTGILKVRYDNGIKIESVPTDIWFPVVDPANVKEVKQHVLAWKYQVGGSQGDWFLNVEIHEKGKVTYQRYALTSDASVSRLLESSEEFTGIDDFLIRPVHNITTSDSVVGNNDYDDINNILEEIEIRLTQISRVLDKHADPKMFGDETALEFNELTGEYVVRGGGDFYPVSEEGQAPQYITWDANLEDAQKHIEVLLRQFYVLSQTSPAAFGQMEAGLVESGSALKRLLTATIIKSNRMKAKFRSAITDVLTIGNKLALSNNATSYGKVLVEFRDSLPEDTYEMVQQEVMRYANGLTSLESALGRIDGISGEALRNEIADIDKREASRQVQGTTVPNSPE